MRSKRIANKNAFLYNVEELRVAIEALPIIRRQTHRDIAEALHVSTGTIRTLVRTGVLICTQRNLKPLLNAGHRQKRLAWANKQLGFAEHGLDGGDDEGDGGRQASTGKDRRKSTGKDNFMRTMHIDEKWFFAQHDGGKVYLTPQEMAPDKAVPHKSHIRKVMFLAAVACLHRLYAGQWFNGKISLLPFVETYLTVCRLKN